jgi:hypothetical protein
LKKSTTDNYKKQIGSGEGNILQKLTTTPFILSRKAFRNFLTQYELKNYKIHTDVLKFFIDYRDDISNLIKHLIKILGPIRAQFCLQVSFVRDDNNLSTDQIGYFCTNSDYISHPNLFQKFYQKIIYEIDNKIQDFKLEGSNWEIDNIMRLDIRVGKYVTQYGSCFTDLPKNLKNKKALINIRNNDDKCFLWCCISKLYPTKKTWQQTNIKFYKKYLGNFNLKGIEFPLDINKVEKFEKMNSHLNLKINVYGFNNIDRKSEVFPIRISRIQAKNQIDLLLYNDHFFLIKNFNRLLGASGKKYHHFCNNCLQGFRSKYILKNHESNCFFNKPSKIYMPTDNRILKFRDYHQNLEYPFVIYAGIY